MRRWLLISLLLPLALVGWGPPPYYQKQRNQHPTAPPVDVLTQDEFVTGLWWDDALWVPIELPDSIMICRPDGTTLRCMPLPKGTVLMLPVPQSD